MNNGLQTRYFVLAPYSSDDEHALASREAMLTYAANISNKQLAEDICKWVENMDLTDNREGK